MLEQLKNSRGVGDLSSAPPLFHAFQTFIHLTFNMNSNIQLLDPSTIEDTASDVTFSLESSFPLPFLPPIQSGDSILANSALRSPEVLIHGLLHRGTKGVLAGPSKAGKTWIMLDLAVAVSTGGDFLNYRTNPGKVLFINFEIHEGFFKERLQKIQESRGIDSHDTLKNLDVWNLRGQNTAADGFQSAMADQIREPGYSLIIIDPIYKLMLGKSEVSTQGVGVLCHDIEHLMAESGASIVYAHHFSKGNQSKKKAMDRLSGSGVFARDADTIITLTEHKMDRCFAVEVTVRNLRSPEPFVVEWAWPKMVMRPDLDPADLENGSKEAPHQPNECLISLLEEGPLTTTEWQKAAQDRGIPRATFFRRMAQLRENGEVEQDPSTKVWSRSVTRVSGDASDT